MQTDGRQVFHALFETVFLACPALVDDDDSLGSYIVDYFGQFLALPD